MIVICPDCGEAEWPYDDLCDFCADVCNSVCNHEVRVLCASCDADHASAVASRDSELPEEGR